MTDTFTSLRRPTTPRPWPAQPIADLLGDIGTRNAAMRLGCSRSAWRRALAHGLTDAQADQWAVRLGRHPAELYGWDVWWRAGITARDERHVWGPGMGWRHAWLWAEYRHAEPEHVEAAA